MDWQLRPMKTWGESDYPWDSWILFRTGNIAQPVAVIQDYEMEKLVEQYMARKHHTTPTDQSKQR